MIQLRKGSTIVAEGDSLTYGYDEVHGDETRPLFDLPFKRSATPYPEALESMLGGAARVINRGVPGDRSYEGVLRWQWASAGDLTIIMYGTNDCFDRTPTMLLSPDTYGRLMKVLIERRRDVGAQVLVLIPPPIFDVANDTRLELYRDIARTAAERAGVMQMETADAIRSVATPFSDGLHLSPEANVAIARQVYELIQLA